MDIRQTIKVDSAVTSNLRIRSSHSLRVMSKPLLKRLRVIETVNGKRILPTPAELEQHRKNAKCDYGEEFLGVPQIYEMLDKLMFRHARLGTASSINQFNIYLDTVGIEAAQTVVADIQANNPKWKAQIIRVPSDKFMILRVEEKIGSQSNTQVSDVSDSEEEQEDENFDNSEPEDDEDEEDNENQPIATSVLTQKETPAAAAASSTESPSKKRKTEA